MFKSLSDKIKGKKIPVVFPEAMDPRIQAAVARLKAEDLMVPILLGNPEEVLSSAKEKGINLEGIEIMDPNNFDAF